MRIELEKPVISINNQRVGSVDSLVVDYNTKEITGIIVRSGVFFEDDRILPIETIDHVEDDGKVILKLSDKETKKQQQFVERDYTRWNPENQPYPYTDEAWVNAAGAPSVFWAYGTEPLGYTNEAPYFAEAPSNPPVDEVQSNLPEQSVLVNEGTDVVGSDGEKIGTVDQVAYTPDGDIDGFVVKAGFIFHNDVRIPGNWIEEISGDIVTLNVTSDEAQSAQNG